MSEDLYKCSYCKDRGYVSIEGKIDEKRYGNKYITEKRALCVCTISDILNKKFEVLSVVPDPSVEMAVKVYKTCKDKNIFFTGSYEKFLYYFKCYASILYNTTSLIDLRDGIGYVHEYYVTNKKTATLNNYAFVGISCISVESNIAISDTVLSIVKDRMVRRKPTWLYSPNSVMFKSSREYSDDLNGFLDLYTPLNLKGEDFLSRVKNKQQNKVDKIARSAQDSIQ